MSRVATFHQTPAKAGLIAHFCCVCDAADAAYGLGPPARAEEVWFCTAHAPDHLRYGCPNAAEPAPQHSKPAVPSPAGDLFGRTAA